MPDASPASAPYPALAVTDIEKAVLAGRALHQPQDLPGGRCCTECRNSEGGAALWPCRSARTLGATS